LPRRAAPAPPPPRARRTSRPFAAFAPSFPLLLLAAAALLLPPPGCVAQTALLRAPGSSTDDGRIIIGGVSISGAPAFRATYTPIFSDYLNSVLGAQLNKTFVTVALDDAETFTVVEAAQLARARAAQRRSARARARTRTFQGFGPAAAAGDLIWPLMTPFPSPFARAGFLLHVPLQLHLPGRAVQGERRGDGAERAAAADAAVHARAHLRVWGRVFRAG
jgi:hypothetical protein